jgi:hypothetical protein
MATAVDSLQTMSTRSRSGRSGLSARLAAAQAQMESVLAELDPDRLVGVDAASLYGSFAGIERLSVAGKTVLAPRIEASGVWREGGHRDAASLLATVEGVSASQARGTLTNGRRLEELPGTEEVLRQGKLSAPKLTELCGAGVLDPARESELLAGAADQPLSAVKERCRRSRATAASHDPLATVRRIHAERFFNSWTDVEGAFCFQGRDTADRGARILNHLGHAADCLQKDAKARPKEPGPGAGGDGDGGSAGGISQRALWADAFFALITQQALGEPAPGGSPDPPGSTGAPPGGPVSSGPPLGAPGSTGAPGARSGPPSSVGPARRGRRPRGSLSPPALSPPTLSPPALSPPALSPPALSPPALSPPTLSPPDSNPDLPSPDALGIITRPPTCTTVVRVDLSALRRGKAEPGELCEIDGQGPVPVAMARDLANDSMLTILFHQAGDVRSISHLGRTINAKLRTALVYRDRTCVVPGCGVGVGLEIDHVHEVHLGGPTELDNLALLCYHHHQLKTYEGWVLTRRGVDPEGQTRWTFEPQPAFGREPGLGIDTDEGRAEWHRPHG